MQAATAADVHSRFGLIIAQADECLAAIRQRERLARQLRSRAARPVAP